MPLISMTEMLERALAGGYAVGYFEAWDIYSLEAVLEAAEALSSPVILGFGGVMLDPGWFNDRGLECLGTLGRTMAACARVPVSLLLNEVFTLTQVDRGIRCGFNSVMMMTANLPFQENVAATRRVVELADLAGVSVEAELGRLPDVGGVFAGGAPSVTDPKEAGEFVRQTGINALAVSIGNVHNLTDGKAEIDFQRLAAIHRATNRPLVIHGGSGFPNEAVAGAIEMGVAKFNVGAILKRLFWGGVKTALDRTSEMADPHDVVGSRKPSDLMVEGKRRVIEEVMRRIRLYRSENQAHA